MSAKDYQLTEAQRRMYQSEKLDNFRWIFKLLARRSPRVLTLEDLVSEGKSLRIAEFGQYAELAYITVPLPFVFQNLSILTQVGFPLEGFNDALQSSELVADFFGEVARLHVYIAFRPQNKQLVVAISGTATASQALQDLRALKHSVRSGAGSVHSGFWAIYKGIKPQALAGIEKGLQEHEVETLVITAHSMGAACSYFLMMDLMSGILPFPSGMKLELALFGSPRPGDSRFAQLWNEQIGEYRAAQGQSSFSEYSVKAYNDGVPTLPPSWMGYRHCSRQPLYFADGCLYHVPESECEFASFSVPDSDQIPLHPLGGHNYYSNRDMERTQRRMVWLAKILNDDQDDWERRYREYAQEKENA
ncbi:Alpha/Beta hydrolase protein [Mycena floridula]|nr:Alpha/Beta hydrolase protein [Mycena floridula]